jgi:hypothetical protein
VYEQVSELFDTTPVHVAALGVAPLASTSCKEPLRKIGSLKVTSIVKLLPARYEPSGVVEVTWVTTGACVSIIIVEEALSEPIAPGDVKVGIASFNAASRIELPLGIVKELAET